MAGVTGTVDLWPVTPVLETARRQLTERLGRAPSMVDMAVLFDVPRETVWRWHWDETRNRIRGRRADRLATALGLHPVELWPDWHDMADMVELVDVAWIVDTYHLGRSWVQSHLTHRPWFPAQVPKAKKRAYWTGHGRSRVWDRAAVEAAMRSQGYGPDAVGLTAAELARELGVPYQTLIGWVHTLPSFPDPVSEMRPRRWLSGEVEAWVESTKQTASPLFARPHGARPLT